jgi:hypothetical protein
MKFKHPMQAIHDAYGIHLKGHDRWSMSNAMGKNDSTAANFNYMKAGLVINCVSKLKPHLTSFAIYCFAPQTLAVDSDINRIYIRLWSDFMRAIDGKKLPYIRQAELSLMVARMLKDYPNAVHTLKTQYTKQELSAAMGRTRLTPEINTYTQIIDRILSQYTGQVLEPVGKIVDEQKEQLANALESEA